MMDQSSRPARKVAIADHIWQAFEEMAASMGSERDALINQAMFMFARLNGFMDGRAGGTPARGVGGPPVLSPVRGSRQMEGEVRAEEDPVRREVAERVLETAAELERLIKGKGQGSTGDEEDEVEASEGGGQLYVMVEGGELDKVTKDRFVIGRGKHCDLVINSGKVSREHAVIVREGDEYFIEDLGSSNGTWFHKQRIKRRKIEDGDEYFICSEKVKLVLR